MATPSKYLPGFDVSGLAINEMRERLGIVGWFANVKRFELITFDDLLNARQFRVLMRRFGVMVSDSFSHAEVVEELEELAGKRPILWVSREGYYPPLNAADRYGFYVMGNQVSGQNASGLGTPMLSTGVQSTFQSKGNLKDWQEAIAARGQGNIYIAAGICCAASSITNRIMGWGNTAMGFFGPSTTGKSTILAICNSMVGAPSKLSGNGTEAGFHVMLRSMSDRFVAVDEVTEGAASNVLPQLIYAIGNGSARVRARKSGEVELQQPINCTLLLSGEKGIFDYLATQGGRFMPGHFARFIGVAPDQPFGCFSDLGPYSTGAEFSREIVNHCNSHYGTFWPTFIKKIFDDQGRTESYLQRNMLKVRATIARSVTSDQNQDLVERLVDNAARVAMAGELATAFKLLPWRSGTATEAMAKTASAWVGRYLAAAMAPADYVQKLRKHIAPLRKQFPNWEEEGLNAKKACWTGFIYEHRAGEKYILISPALMEAVFGKEGVSKAVEALRESGLILPGERGAALKEIRIPGTAEKIRFYFIKKDVMKPNS